MKTTINAIGNAITISLIVIISILLITEGYYLLQEYLEYRETLAHMQYCENLASSAWLSDKAEFVANCMKYVM